MSGQPEKVTVWAALFIKENCVNEFIEAAKKVVELTRKEKGCLQYDLLRDIFEPTKFIFNEEYENDAAFEIHRNSEYLKEFREIRARLVEKYAGVRTLKETGVR